MTQKTKVRQSLRLIFNGGVTSTGRNKKITRSYANTSYAATPEELQQAGRALAGLYGMELMDVAVLEESLLKE